MSAQHSRSKLRPGSAAISMVLLALSIVLVVAMTRYLSHTVRHDPAPARATPTALPQNVKPSFDPGAGAPLPEHRVVAFYAVPDAAATGPAYQLSDAMLARLRSQADQYQALDPAHPVVAGIDLVVSVPDRYSGPAGTYSHRVDRATIDRYVEFCRANGLVLFLDLNFGWSDPLTELNAFRDYFKLPFVHVAVDPEWMFPRHNGVPGTNLSNVRAADLNPLIQAVAAMPQEFQVPRKMFIIHQYRPDGDGLANPYDPGAALIADKRNLVDDDRVDVVVHVDSVGGWPGDIQVKTQQYNEWVAQGMQQYHNFRYGGFKIFYQLESKNRLMTPQEVMALQPPPMVITYGN
ncbi:hypothetical protein [Dactylosporangium salmoneum]